MWLTKQRASANNKNGIRLEASACVKGCWDIIHRGCAEEAGHTCNVIRRHTFFSIVLRVIYNNIRKQLVVDAMAVARAVVLESPPPSDEPGYVPKSPPLSDKPEYVPQSPPPSDEPDYIPESPPPQTNLTMFQSLHRPQTNLAMFQSLHCLR